MDNPQNIPSDVLPTPQQGKDAPRLPKLAYGRALLIGALLTPANAYWVMAAEMRWHNIITINPLFVTPIFYLFVVVLLNKLITRCASRFRLSTSELVIVYVMLVMSCTVVTHDYLLNWFTMTTWPQWMATPENRWEHTIIPLLPKWLLVWDKKLIEGMYYGHSDPYNLATLKMWLPPILIWTAFSCLIGWMLLCLAVLVRKAWMEETRLSFPIVRLPLTLTEEHSPGSIFRSRALWWGFGLVATMNIVNGLHGWFPNIPFMDFIRTPIYFSTPPWTAAASQNNPMFLTIMPFSIGLAFLIPLDVSFSCWFFYLFFRLQAVFGYQMGYGIIPDFPFETEQAIGAWYAFGFFLLFSIRGYIVRVFKTAMGNKSGMDANEPMSYKFAFWNLVAGSAVFFMFWCSTGMNPLFTLLMLFTFLLLALCITRIRAEAGAVHDTRSMEPHNLCKLFGTQLIGPVTLAGAAMNHWYWRGNRSHMMPSQMEAFKLAQENGMDSRRLVFPIMLAILLATVFGIWTGLHVLYRDGALAKCEGFPSYVGTQSIDWLSNAVNQGLQPQANRWMAVGFGAGIVALLSFLRVQFVGFPFHPLGYCIGAGMMWHWFPFFVAWFLKLVILRYGGLKFYRSIMPFFLGIVLGDYFTGAGWALIGIIWNVPVYKIWGA